MRYQKDCMFSKTQIKPKWEQTKEIPLGKHNLVPGNNTLA